MQALSAIAHNYQIFVLKYYQQILEDIFQYYILGLLLILKVAFLATPFVFVANFVIMRINPPIIANPAVHIFNHFFVMPP